MSINQSERTTLIHYRIEKAKKAAEDVLLLIDMDKLHLAVNRIYYGCFYILSALALKHHFPTVKHQTLIGWFNKTFLKENVIESKYGKFIHKAYDKRSKADYADYIEFEKEDIMSMYLEMKEFLIKIEELITTTS